MILTTRRLLLSIPQSADLAALYAIYGDPATQRFNPAGPLTDITQAKELLDEWQRQWRVLGYGQWAVALKAEPDRVLGFGGIGMWPYLGEPRMNLGYRFAQSAWGQGLATELGQAALTFGLVEHQLPAIFGLVRPEHAASIRVLEKIGMQRFGTLDDVPGQAHSLVLRALAFQSDSGG